MENNRPYTVFNDMQTVKRRLFAMRNGIIADTLRKGGSPFSIIFGVNLPQLVEIAKDTGKNPDLAIRLWNNSSTRESMLLAPMLMPVDEFSRAQAEEWISQMPSTEVADILCHRLLRHTPYASQIVDDLVVSEDFMKRYTGLRLMCNIASEYPEKAVGIGRNELKRDDARTRLLALQLIDYAD